MADAVSSLQKQLTDLQRDTKDFFESMLYSESMEEKVAESKIILKVIEEKRKNVDIAIGRLRNVSAAYRKIDQLKNDRKDIVKKKEVKIMTIIKAKNELSEGIEQIKANDLFVKKPLKAEDSMESLELTRSRIKEISNFSHSINYLRTDFARTMVHNLPWSSSILHQNSER